MSQTLEELQQKLKKFVIDTYEPESTRWHRNYTDRAEWYFIWNIELDIKFDEDKENFEELKRQIAIFAEHRTESGKSFAYYAPGEEHDDMVMALLLLLHLARYYLREKNKGFGVASRSYTSLRNNDEDLLGSGIPANATLKYRSVTNP